MIEITHKQARRLVRESLDRRLVDDQWAGLQTHLEGCADCREYRGRLQSWEKEARRVLRGRWEAILETEAADVDRIAAYRRKRDRRLKRMLAAGSVILALLSFWFLGGFGWLAQAGSAPALLPAAEPPLPVMPTYLPTARAGELSTLLVFASVVDGDSDLYLLNLGGQPENLTGAAQAPGIEDTDPAWSPDGEWIAYLSDRTGKPEVYVTGLVKHDPVQLTNEPAVDWRGPLSWSQDGRLLALVGTRRDQGGQAWVYLVPMDGSGPWSLAGTRGSWAPEFSPAEDRLAYMKQTAAGASLAVHSLHRFDQPAELGLDRYWAEPPGQGTTAEVEAAGRQPLSDLAYFDEGSALDWAPDGRGLAYIGAALEGGRGGSGVIVERELSFGTNRQENYPRFSRVAESRWPLAYRAVTWSPGGAILYLEDLADARAAIDPARSDPCWTLRHQPLDSQGAQRRTYLAGDLCVESGLDRSVFSPDGEWLLLVGRPLDAAGRSLYAVRLPDSGESDEPQPEEALLRLLDEEWHPGQPRVRPAGPRLAVYPQPVLVWQSPAPLSDASRAAGEIVYSIQNNTAGVIVSANPDGTGGKVLTSSEGENRCPRWSPDGERVAFVSDRDGRPGGSNTSPQEIYMIGPGGSVELVSDIGLVPATGRGDGYRTAARYGCPVWAPDGSYLSATVEVGEDFFLAVIPVGAERQVGAGPRFVRIGRPAGEPAWTPGGHNVVLASGSPAEVLMVRLPARSSEPLSAVTLDMPDQSIDVQSLLVSEDGQQIYLLAARADNRLARQTMLRRLNLFNRPERPPLPLTADFVIRGVRPGELSLLADGGLGLVVTGRPDQRYKSLIQRYNLNRRTLQTLAAFGDYINSAAWSPDGRWVIFSAESGLWLLDVQASQSRRAAPVWISPQPVDDLDWRGSPAAELPDSPADWAFTFPEMDSEEYAIVASTPGARYLSPLIAGRPGRPGSLDR